MKTLRVLTTSLLLTGGMALNTQADWWVLGGTGDWNVGANWSGGVVPNNSGGWAIGEIINGTGIINTTVPTVSEAWAGNNGMVGNIIVTNGGTLNVANWLVAARNGGGGNTPLSAIRVDGGTVNKSGDGFLIGEDGNCLGQLFVTGNGVVNVTGGWFGVGNGSGRGWIYVRDNGQLLLSDGRDFNIGDWGTARGWCYLQDNARIDVRKFWVGKNDTAGVMIQSGGILQGYTPTANEWRIGEGASSYGFYQLTGGTFNNPNNLHIGASGKGLWYQSGGTNTTTGWTAPGRYSGGWGIMHLTGGRFVHNGTGTHLFSTEQGRGEINVSGTGVLDCNLSLVLAHAYGGATGNGYLNVNGGTVRVPLFERWGDAPGGLAFMSLNGGTIQAKQNEAAFLQNMTDARVYPGGAKFDSSGFDITVNQALLAPTGNGVATIPVTDGGSGYMGPPVVGISAGGGSGATAVALMVDDGLGAGTYRLDSIVITCPGRDFTSAPTVTLYGGLPGTAATLGTPTIAPNVSGGLTKSGLGVLALGGANTFTGPTVVNGGTLRANVPNAISATANLNVVLGTTFDLNNNNQTVGSVSGAGNITLGSATLTAGGDGSSTTLSGTITGTGALTKNGGGTLTLPGANNYSGATAINGGKVATTTATTGTGDITLADGTALGLERMTASGQINPANATLAASTAATLDFNLGAFGNPTLAPINVTGTLTVNGAITVNVAGANLAVGLFPLISYGTRAGAGSFAVGTLPPRIVAEVVTNGSTIALNVTAVETPKWAGLVSGGFWNTSDTNWVGTSSGVPTTFANGDQVLFDDSAPGTKSVRLDAVVQPASVTFNNTTPYIVYGAGKISGTAGISLNAAGVVGLATSGNDFSGDTVLNAGLLVTDPNALSANSALKVQGGTLDISGNNQNAGAVTLASGTIAGSGGTITASSYDVRSGDISANLGGGGGGGLTKSTPGTVTLSGANTYTGTTLINGGTLIAGNVNTLSPNSPVNIAGSGLDIQGNDQAAGAVTLTTGTIDGSATLTAPSFNVQSGTVAPNLAGPGTLTKSAAGSVTLDGNLGYAGQTIVNGGTLTLNGNNTYPGGTVINSGTAIVSADANLGAGNISLAPAATLRVAGTTTFNSGKSVSVGTLSWAWANFDVAGGSVGLFSGPMSGAGADTHVIKEGAGEMIYTGTSSFGDATHLYVNRGTLTLSNNANVSVNRWSGVGIASGSDGALTMKGNSVLTVAHDFNIGDAGATRARFLLMDNAVVNCNYYGVGKPADCVGATYQVGGAIVGTVPASDWRIGGNWGNGDTGAYGFHLQAGGTFTNVNNWQVGAYAQGVYYQSAGINVQSSWAVFGRFPGAPSSGYGVGYLTGGQFIHNQAGQHLIIGEHGRGEFTVAGSAQVDLASALWVGLDYGGSVGNGTVNLNGGVLATPAVNKTGPGATGYLNLNGGLLRAKASEANFISGFTAAYVYPGGAVIDSDVHDITIPQTLEVPAGNGVASISVDSAGSSYLGPPIVIIGGDGSGATAVAEIDYFAGTVTNIIVTCPGRGYTTATVTLSGGGGSGATATATLGANASGGLTKLGSGSLTLSGVTPFEGPVVVSNGTLSCMATLAGTVTVHSGGTLALGPTIEDLVVNNDVTLSGNVRMKIDRDNGVSTADFLSARALALGGRLTVVNIGSAPQAGDAFQLFDALSFSGTFAEFDMPALPAGLAWDTTHVDFDGWVVVHHAPTAGNDDGGTVMNTAVSFSFDKVLLNDDDLDSDPIQITSFTQPTAGGTVTLGSTNFVYVPLTNSVGNDTFTYTITDGRGGTNTATISVVITDGNANGLGGVEMEGTNARVRFMGVPNFTYTIVRGTNLPNPTWQPIGTAQADGMGRVSFLDTNKPLGEAFYRTRYP